MKSLKIVPVAITYEFDPNDLAKARELDIREKNNGAYTKDKYEDIETIIRGIRDYKGRVKLVCGEPIVSGFDTAEELCELIDNFIYNNYEMYPSALKIRRSLSRDYSLIQNICVSVSVLCMQNPISIK